MSQRKTREEAIAWCVKTKCNFIRPVYPAPSGWAWDVQESDLALVNTMLGTSDRPITLADLTATHSAPGQAADYTREQAMQWCIDKDCDFLIPVMPPPKGWAWASGSPFLTLEPLMLNLKSETIRVTDISA